MKTTTSSSEIRHRRPFRILCFVPVLLSMGCSPIPHRTIFITDKGGRPIPDATVVPYPFLIRNFKPGSQGNSTDLRGRIELYNLTPGSDYIKLSARGFSDRRIAFPQQDKARYTLKPEN